MTPTGFTSTKQSHRAARPIRRVDARIQKMKSKAICGGCCGRDEGWAANAKPRNGGRFRARDTSSVGSAMMRAGQFHLRGAGVGLCVVVRYLWLFAADG